MSPRRPQPRKQEIPALNYRTAGFIKFMETRVQNSEDTSPSSSETISQDTPLVANRL